MWWLAVLCFCAAGFVVTECARRTRKQAGLVLVPQLVETPAPDRRVILSKADGLELPVVLLKELGLPLGFAACVRVRGNDLPAPLWDNGLALLDMRADNRSVEDGGLYAIDQQGLLKIRRVEKIECGFLRLVWSAENTAGDVVAQDECRILGRLLWFCIQLE